MAEFSKQYQELTDFDWSDFDYEDIFNKLEPGWYQAQICEGLGVLGDSGASTIGLIVTFCSRSSKCSSALSGSFLNLRKTAVICAGEYSDA